MFINAPLIVAYNNLIKTSSSVDMKFIFKPTIIEFIIIYYTMPTVNNVKKSP